MLQHPDFDPVAISLGPLQVHWYGLMYLAGFAVAWWLALRDSRRPGSVVQKNDIEDLAFYSMLGVILGGRLGYGLFYGLDAWLDDPLWIFRVWEGGMAFHGGLLGVGVALLIFAWRKQRPFLAVFDFVAPLAPIGLGLGRIGNFIGQELWGRATDLPWAMVFSRDPLQLARHPSQLYQAVLEGVLLFLIVYAFSRKPRPAGSITGLFLCSYSLFRFLVEFVREPDSHIGFAWLGWMTRGQELCLPMFLGGVALIVWAYRQSARKPA